MIRGVLSFLFSASALGAGLLASDRQSANFERGAELHELQLEVEWYERRISGLAATLERFEFEEWVRLNGLADVEGTSDTTATPGGEDARGVASPGGTE